MNIRQSVKENRLPTLAISQKEQQPGKVINRLIVLLVPYIMPNQNEFFAFEFAFEVPQNNEQPVLRYDHI